MSEKNLIPHTNPEWGLENPDGDLNSLVDKHGTNHDDGFNFDEKDDEEDNEKYDVDSTAADSLKKAIEKKKEDGGQ